MRADWRPDEGRYLGRVTKALILVAVAQAVGEEAAGRLAGLKKAEMVAAAEPIVLDAGWLPAELRTAVACDGPGPADQTI